MTWDVKTRKSLAALEGNGFCQRDVFGKTTLQS